MASSVKSPSPITPPPPVISLSASSPSPSPSPSPLAPASSLPPSSSISSSPSALLSANNTSSSSGQRTPTPRDHHHPPPPPPRPTSLLSVASSTTSIRTNDSSTNSISSSTSSSKSITTTSTTTTTTTDDSRPSSRASYNRPRSRQSNRHRYSNSNPAAMLISSSSSTTAPSSSYGSPGRSGGGSNDFGPAGAGNGGRDGVGRGGLRRSFHSSPVYGRTEKIGVVAAPSPGLPMGWMNMSPSLVVNNNSKNDRKNDGLRGGGRNGGGGGDDDSKDGGRGGNTTPTGPTSAVAGRVIGYKGKVPSISVVTDRKKMEREMEEREEGYPFPGLDIVVNGGSNKSGKAVGGRERTTTSPIKVRKENESKDVHGDNSTRRRDHRQEINHTGKRSSSPSLSTLSATLRNGKATLHRGSIRQGDRIVELIAVEPDDGMELGSEEDEDEGSESDPNDDEDGGFVIPMIRKNGSFGRGSKGSRGSRGSRSGSGGSGGSKSVRKRKSLGGLFDTTISEDGRGDVTGTPVKTGTTTTGIGGRGSMRGLRRTGSLASSLIDEEGDDVIPEEDEEDETEEVTNGRNDQDEDSSEDEDEATRKARRVKDVEEAEKRLMGIGSITSSSPVAASNSKSKSKSKSSPTKKTRLSFPKFTKIGRESRLELSPEKNDNNESNLVSGNGYQPLIVPTSPKKNNKQKAAPGIEDENENEDLVATAKARKRASVPASFHSVFGPPSSASSSRNNQKSSGANLGSIAETNSDPPRPGSSRSNIASTSSSGGGGDDPGSRSTSPWRRPQLKRSNADFRPTASGETGTSTVSAGRRGSNASVTVKTTDDDVRIMKDGENKENIDEGGGGGKESARDAEERKRKRDEKRDWVARELLETERSYVDVLETIDLYYLSPLLSALQAQSAYSPALPPKAGPSSPHPASPLSSPRNSFTAEKPLASSTSSVPPSPLSTPVPANMSASYTTEEEEESQDQEDTESPIATSSPSPAIPSAFTKPSAYSSSPDQVGNSSPLASGAVGSRHHRHHHHHPSQSPRHRRLSQPPLGHAPSSSRVQQIREKERERDPFGTGPGGRRRSVYQPRATFDIVNGWALAGSGDEKTSKRPNSMGTLPEDAVAGNESSSSGTSPVCPPGGGGPRHSFPPATALTTGPVTSTSPSSPNTSGENAFPSSRSQSPALPSIFTTPAQTVAPPTPSLLTTSTPQMSQNLGGSSPVSSPSSSIPIPSPVSSSTLMPSGPILSRKSINTIFSNFADILVLAREILRRLEVAHEEVNGVAGISSKEDRKKDGHAHSVLVANQGEKNRLLDRRKRRMEEGRQPGPIPVMASGGGGKVTSRVGERIPMPVEEASESAPGTPRSSLSGSSLEGIDKATTFTTKDDPRNFEDSEPPRLPPKPDIMIGKHILPLTPFLKTYSLFIQNFEYSLAMLSRLESPSTSGAGFGAASKFSPVTSPLHSPSSPLYMNSGGGSNSGGDGTTDLRLEGERWKRFVAVLKKQGIGSGLGLGGMLLAVIQRIPRYRMLLSDMIKYTDYDHADKENLIKAHNNIEEVASFLESQIRQHDSFRRGLEIQRLFVTPPDFPLVAPGRKLLKEGRLTKLTSKGKEEEQAVFLFSDVILFASIVDQSSGWMGLGGLDSKLFGDITSPGIGAGSGSGGHYAPINKPLNFVGRMKLQDVTVVGVEDPAGSHRHSFEIRSPTTSFAMFARTGEQKTDWMTSIRQSSEEFLDNRRTLQAAPLTLRRNRRRASAPSFTPDLSVIPPTREEEELVARRRNFANSSPTSNDTGDRTPLSLSNSMEASSLGPGGPSNDNNNIMRPASYDGDVSSPGFGIKRWSNISVLSSRSVDNAAAASGRTPSSPINVYKPAGIQDLREAVSRGKINIGDPKSLNHNRTHNSMGKAEAQSHGNGQVQAAMAGDDYSAPVWVPDTKTDRCMVCGTPFSIWKRRHHCRLCGRVVCWACSKKSFIIPSTQEGHPDRLARACDTCFTSVFQIDSSRSFEGEKSTRIQETPTSSFPSSSSLANSSGTTAPVLEARSSITEFDDKVIRTSSSSMGTTAALGGLSSSLNMTIDGTGGGDQEQQRPSLAQERLTSLLGMSTGGG